MNINLHMQACVCQGCNVEGEITDCYWNNDLGEPGVGWGWND